MNKLKKKHNKPLHLISLKFLGILHEIDILNYEGIFFFSPGGPSWHEVESNPRSLAELIVSCVSVPANFPSSTAAAVRAGLPIVQTNKGRRGHSHFHKSFSQRGRGKKLQPAHSLTQCVWCGATLKLFL